MRRYGPDDAAPVRFIKSAQRIGFSLDEVAQLLQLEDGTRCAQAREIAAHRLLGVRRRLADLQRLEDVLSALVARCEGGSRPRCLSVDRVVAGGCVMEPRISRHQTTS